MAEHNHSQEMNSLLEPGTENAAFARQIGAIDFSSESRGKSTLRARLLEQHERKGRRPSPLSIMARIALVTALAAALVIGLDALIHRSLPGIVQPAASQRVTRTPRLPTATAAPSETPTLNPTKVAPIGKLISPDSDAMELMRAIIAPQWDSLWLQGLVTYYPEDNSDMEGRTMMLAQAWLEKDGWKRAISTDLQSANPLSSYIDTAVRWAWLSDGVTLQHYDSQGDPQLTLVPVETLNVSPEIFHPVVMLAYPMEFALRSSTPEMVMSKGPDGPQPTVVEIAGRETLVVDWMNDQLFVDEETGLILRREHYRDAQKSRLDYVITLGQVVFDPPMPANLSDPNALSSLQFEAAPGDPGEPQVTEQDGLTVEVYPIQATVHDSDLESAVHPEPLTVLARRGPWRDASVSLGDLSVIDPFGYHFENLTLYKDDQALLENVMPVAPVWVDPQGGGFGLALQVQDAYPSERYFVFKDRLLKVVEDSGTSFQVLDQSSDQEVYHYDYTPTPAVAGGILRQWVWDGKWIIEVPGSVVVDGVPLNEQYGHEETFGWQLMGGKPFYFFIQDGQVGISYDGNPLPVRFDQVPHNQCCSGALMNPQSNLSMVWFYAWIGEQRYYVEAGVYQ